LVFVVVLGARRLRRRRALVLRTEPPPGISAVPASIAWRKADRSPIASAVIDAEDDELILIADVDAVHDHKRQARDI